MEEIPAARPLVRALRQRGIERIFGLSGDHVNSIFDACGGEGVAVVVDTRPEAGVTPLADGRARVTGQPAGA